MHLTYQEIPERGRYNDQVPLQTPLVALPGCKAHIKGRRREVNNRSERARESGVQMITSQEADHICISPRLPPDGERWEYATTQRNGWRK